MDCLWCHTPIETKVNWSFFFGLTTEQLLCIQCSERLEKITGECCDKCGRSFQQLDFQYRKGSICSDCAQWGDGALLKNRSLYSYNEFLREVIAKWKYRGDVELVKLFWPELKKLSKQFPKIDIVVPIPLSDERLYERSFNQAKELAKGLSYPIVEALAKKEHTTKQSKRSRKERLNREERFQMVPSFLYDLHGKNVLLVDDIYTTGATLYAAATVLKNSGAAQVFSLTIARG